MSECTGGEAGWTSSSRRNEGIVCLFEIDRDIYILEKIILVYVYNLMINVEPEFNSTKLVENKNYFLDFIDKKTNLY